jgi:O-antigen/teichoic acid export membrane protein
MQSVDVAKRSVSSTILLSVGNFVQTGLLAVVSIVMARLLGPETYGEYNLAITPPLLFSIFVDFGAIYSVQRYASYYVSKGEFATARRMTRSAITLTLLTGSILTVVSLLASYSLSAIMLHRPSLAPYVEIASSVILTQTLFVCITIAFLGWNSPAYTSGLNILYAVLKFAVIGALLILGFGLFGAVVGYAISYSLAAIVGATTLYFVKLRETPAARNPPFFHEAGSSARSAMEELAGKQHKSSWIIFFEDVKKILHFGVPAYIGGSVSQFATTSFVLIVLAAFVSNGEIGFYQAAYNVALPITIVATAIGFSLFSAFASLDGIQVDVFKPFRLAAKYVAIVMVPLVFFAIGASNAIVVTFYGSSYEASGSIYSLIALSILPLAVGPDIFTSFFNGIGKTKLTLVLQLIGSAVILTLAPAFGFLGLGVRGIIYSLIASSVIFAAVGSYLVKRYANSSIDFHAAGRILLVSAMCLLAMYIIQVSVHLLPYLLLVLDFGVFFGLYLTLLPILRALTPVDLQRIGISTSSLGLLRSLTSLVLRYETLLMKLTHQITE